MSTPLSHPNVLGPFCREDELPDSPARDIKHDTHTRRKPDAAGGGVGRGGGGGVGVHEVAGDADAGVCLGTPGEDLRPRNTPGEPQQGGMYRENGRETERNASSQRERTGGEEEDSTVVEEDFCAEPEVIQKTETVRLVPKP